jgi:hypothetical protein
MLKTSLCVSEGVCVTVEGEPITRPDQSYPLASDPVLFDMYLTALDSVLARPEIATAIEEFGLSAERLRGEMMLAAASVLRATAAEFAAYEEARARNDADGDPGRIDYSWRRVPSRLAGLQMRAAGGGGAILLLAGLVSVRFWWPAVVLINAGVALLAAAAVILGVWKVLTTEYGRMLLERTAHSGDRLELALARNHLVSAVRQNELLAEVRAYISAARQGRLDREYVVSTSPGLSEVYDSINRVPTESAAELRELLARLDGASIGIAGPRGSGKSMLIRQYCEEDGVADENLGEISENWLGGQGSAQDTSHNLRCMVAAPVDYAAKDFVLHLFATFCQSVIQKYGLERSRKDRMIQIFSWLELVGSVAYSLLWRVIIFGGAAAALWRWQRLIAADLSIRAGIVRYVAIVVICLGVLDFVWAMARLVVRRGLGREARDGDEREIVANAKKQLAKVRYLQTHTSGLSGSVNLPGGTKGQLARGISRAEQPLSYPEIVDQFRSFARNVASTVHKRGFRVFIGVDELDKIGSAEQAERFLNEIKGIFGIPYLYFIVSVSDDALTAFERRGLPLRDAFDSSFDEIIRVGPLTYPESRRLLYRRMIGLSEPYVGLCYCLAGGLARDLIRSARNVVRTAANLIEPLEADGATIDSDNPVEYLLASDKPAPQFPNIGAIAEAVIRDELRRKLRAINHVTSGVGSLESTGFQDLLYDVAGQLSSDEPILSVVDLLAKPVIADSAVAVLRLELAAYAYYCATLQEVFSERMSDQQIIEATSQPAQPGSFETLASAKNAFTLSTMLAWRLNTQFRAAWSMETREPPHQQLHKGTQPEE